MAVVLSVSLSPVPLPADVPGDVTLELVLRNAGDAPVLVFPAGAGFHDAQNDRGPRFECSGLRFPLKYWHSGTPLRTADWWARRARTLEPGASATRSIPCCWIPRRFVAPDGERSWIAFDHSAKWAQQFRGRAPDAEHSNSTWIVFDKPGQGDLRFEYIQPESDVDLFGLGTSMHVVARPLTLEIA